MPDSSKDANTKANRLDRDECVLESKPCTQCGKCDRCDLNPEKICDNCMTCIVLADYRAVKVDEIITEDPDKKGSKKYRWFRSK